MSKNYSLEISTSANGSLVEFTVKNKASWFLKHARLPTAVALCAWAALVLRSTRWPLDEQPYLLIALAVAVVALLAAQEPSDKFMVMENMGVEILSRSRWRFMNQSGRFIPLSDIIDIVIHEGFHGYGQVTYYMCVLRRGRDKVAAESTVMVIFPNFLPRKDILLQVWQLSRRMLYGKTRRQYRRVPGQGLREVRLH